MLSEEADGALRSRGLVPAPKVWTQFGFTPRLAALECPWGAGDASDPEVYYAWAQLAPGERDEFVALLTENGYSTEETERGSWMVTPPELAGGGVSEALMTDEWVAFANTREAIDDIVWTR